MKWQHHFSSSEPQILWDGVYQSADAAEKRVAFFRFFSCFQPVRAPANPLTH